MGTLSKVLVFAVVLVVTAAGVAVAANRIGDNNANTLNGTTGADVVYGLGGNDTLNGGAGNDEVSGNARADQMNGGANDDIMIGGTGVDNIKTGPSTDSTGGGFDFTHASDGNAETVCVGTGDWVVLHDETDTILGPPNCSTQIHPPPSSATAAATEAGNDGPLTTTNAKARKNGPVTTSSVDR